MRRARPTSRSSRTLRAGRLALAGLLLAACASESGEPNASVAVSLHGVMMDPATESPVIVLEEQAGDRRLPIWIGPAEARSIAQELERVKPPRPNTHDMAKRLLDGLEGVLERATVTELRGGIFYALLDVRIGDRTVQIDVRPSDAIALALRSAAPLFVREQVFVDAGRDDDVAETSGKRI